jgi:hypothetical protein
MENHECPRCGYATIYLYNFKKHLNRKSICNPIIDNISLDDIKNKYITVKIFTHSCEICDIKFSSKSSYYVHKRECKISQKLKEDKHVITNIITNNNINIQINNFGNENVSYLLEHPTFMIGCIQKNYMAFVIY